jgi:hypothetical protein
MPDPPDEEAIKVAVCPLSIVNEGTETARAVLTVTVTAFEATVTGVEELSVIWSSNDQMPVPDTVSIPDIGPGTHANGEPKSL